MGLRTGMCARMSIGKRIIALFMGIVITLQVAAADNEEQKDQRRREVVKSVLNALRRYGSDKVDKDLSTVVDHRKVMAMIQKMQVDLDRIVILERTIRDRENAIVNRDRAIEEYQGRNMKLTLEKNRGNIAKALAKSLPEWKSMAEELKKLRGDLPDKRLADMIMPLKPFDKNGDAIIDATEMKQVVKGLSDGIGLSSKFGLELFDKNKDGKLDDQEYNARNRLFGMVALERLVDLDSNGKITAQEAEIFAMAEVMHFNALAERYAGIIAKQEIPPATKTVAKKDSRSDYRIQSIKSGNSLLIGRSNFTVPATLYGVQLPKDDTAQLKAREYLVTLLADESYRIDNKSSATDARKTLSVLEKLSTIVITKISFVDTRISIVFEFLKNRSRAFDPTGEGVDFIIYPEPKVIEDKAPQGDNENDENFMMDDDIQTNEPVVTMDLDNHTLADIILAVAQFTGSTIELDGGAVYVRLPDAKPRKKQDTLLQLSLYLPKKGRTINYLLIRNGLAPCSLAEVKTPAEKELIEAQALAKKEELGIWAK